MPQALESSEKEARPKAELRDAAGTECIEKKRRDQKAEPRDVTGAEVHPKNRRGQRPNPRGDEGVTRVHPKKKQDQKADVAFFVFKSMFENYLSFSFHEF